LFWKDDREIGEGLGGDTTTTSPTGLATRPAVRSAKLQAARRLSRNLYEPFIAQGELGWGLLRVPLGMRGPWQVLRAQPHLLFKEEGADGRQLHARVVGVAGPCTLDSPYRKGGLWRLWPVDARIQAGGKESRGQDLKQQPHCVRGVECSFSPCLGRTPYSAPVTTSHLADRGGWK
jgi:hypothetical protein